MKNNECKRFVTPDRIRLEATIAADFQDGFSISTAESFDLAEKAIKLGVDLASFYTRDDGDAIDEVSRYMLDNACRVKDFAEMTNGEKAALVYELALIKYRNVIDDADYKSDSFPNQVKKLKAEIEEAQLELGNQILSIAMKLFDRLKAIKKIN